MPVGHKGEKRPADTIANAVLVARIATGEAKEEYVAFAKSRNGKKGGKKRAEALSAERRSEIARQGADARWSK